MIFPIWRSAILVGIATLLSTVQASNDGPFQDGSLRGYILDDLYDEISERLAQYPHKYYSDSESEQSTSSVLLPQSIGYDYGSTVSPKWVNIRHPEEEDNIALSGYQSMSGGAGEGKQHLKPEGSVSNKQEVKTDAQLPSYCSPPNPCPKGKTAADGCQERIPDTAEFNRDYILAQMKEGYCECDYEHMEKENCPMDTSDSYGRSLSNIDVMLDEIFHSELGEKIIDKQNPFVSDGEKRKSMTAKKGGKTAVQKRSVQEPTSLLVNRYLQGPKLPVVAKKSPHMN